MKNPGARDLQGFTLLEILIALMMTATVMGALFTVFVSSLDVAQEVEQSARDNQMMRMVMDRITRDLRSFVFLSAEDMRVSRQAENGTETGDAVQADLPEKSLPVFTGYEPDSTGEEMVLMSFPTLAALNFENMMPGERINEVRYIVRLQDGDGKRYALFRQERPYAGLYPQIAPQEIELADGMGWGEESFPHYVDETGEIFSIWDGAQRATDKKSIVPQLITWVFTLTRSQGISRTYTLAVHPLAQETKS